MVSKKTAIEKMMELERENNATVGIVIPTRRFHDQAWGATKGCQGAGGGMGRPRELSLPKGVV